VTFTDAAACGQCGAVLVTPDDWWPEKVKPLFRTCIHFTAAVVPFRAHQIDLPFAGGVPLTVEDYHRSVKSAQRREGRLFP